MRCLLIILLLIANSLFAQSDSSSTLIMEDSGYLYKSNYSTFKTIDKYTFYFNGIKDIKVYNSGKRFYKSTFYTNGQLKSNCIVKVVVSGERNVLDYSDKDSVSSITCNNYLDVIYNGKYLEYYEQGLIKVIGFYSNGQKVGKWKTYNLSGKLIKTDRWELGSNGNDIEYNRW